MGILDSLLNTATDASAHADANAGNSLPPALLDSLSELMSARGNNAGSGLEDLVQRFGNAGLGDIISSWIGHGENAPVTGTQLQGILGSDFIAGLASKLGVDPATASHLIAQWLPRLVDQLTPGGRLPQQPLREDPSLLSAIAGALLKPRS